MTTSVTRKKLPLRCPACDAPLRVSKMICGRCATEVSGEFELPVLTSLNEEEQRFMLEFVKASGSLKDMEKKMERKIDILKIGLFQLDFISQPLKKA